MKKLLEVKNLSTSFYTHLGEVQAVRNISFSLNEGDVLGIVGESGSGKSVTALSIMRLVGIPGKIKAGQILKFL
jgi:oligopeptide transport system ATP-binding protein